MDKINTFFITELTMSGFKCFDEPTTLRFGQLTQITGRNGAGKSSIADAIAFAITGVSFWGDTKLDRLYHGGGANGRELSVDLSFSDADGAIHRLVRNRKKDHVSITLDGVDIRQTDLTAMFGEKDIFLSMLNPLYFIERLGDKGRDLLMRYLPSVKHDAIMERLDDQTRALLEGEGITSPDSYLKALREDIRESKEAITYTEGQRDLLKEQAGARANRIVELRAAMERRNAAIAELEAKQYEQIDVRAKQRRLDDVYAAIDELSGQTTILANPDSVDGVIAAMTEKLAQTRAKVYASKYAEPISAATQTINMLQREYTQTSAVRKNLKPGVQCATCRQAITEGNIEAVRAGLDQRVDELIQRGRAERGKLAELEELDRKAKEVFIQFQKDDAVKQEAEIAELKSARAIAANELREEVQALEYDLRFGNLTEGEFEQLCAMRSERDSMEAEILSLSGSEGKSEQETEAVIDSLKETIKDKERLMKAAALYMSKRMGLLFSDFAMNRVAISLYNVVKATGEAKDAFDFTYEGRPYQWLSLSEKIKAGLEVSQLIGRLTGSTFPTFVDNAESVPVIDNVKPAGQVFFARVQKGAGLNVSTLGALAAAEAKAA